MFVANLKRTNANEMYVRRVLQEQVGIDPLDLDVMAMNHRYVYRLSVRHNIEPVVAYLRSQGLTGSALAHFLAGCPATLAKDVDDTLMPLCEFLRARLGDRAIGVLVKHPPLAEVAPSQLRAADQVLKAASVPEEHIVLLLWQFPDLFARLARAVHTAKSQQRNGGAVAGDLGGREALGRGIIAVGEALVTAARVSGMKGGPQGIRGELERSIRIIEGSNN